MSIACSCPRESRCQRAASTPISSSELVEEDDVAPAFRHLARLAALRQLDELVDEHLDGLRVVAERARDRLQPRDVAVVVGAEDVDEALEAAPALEAHVARHRPRSTWAARPRARRPGPCRRPTRGARASARPPARRASSSASASSRTASISLCRTQRSMSTRKRSSVSRICASMGSTGSPSCVRQLRDVVALVAVGRRILASCREPRPTRGRGRSARPRRSRRTRARRSCPRSRAAGRPSRRRPRSGRSATVRGPVGSRTRTPPAPARARRGRTAAVAAPGREDLAERLAVPARGRAGC